MTNEEITRPTAQPRRLALFGATGGVGRRVLDLALAEGHHVVALCRDPSRLDVAHDRLTVVEGDVLDPDAVARVVGACDSVLVALGAPAMSKSRVRSEGTAVIVRAMQRTGVRRLLCVSVYGAAETYADLPWLYRHVIFPLYLRRAVADHERQEAIIADSDLDWTIVRPPNLTDGPRTGRYDAGFGSMQGRSLNISRADVADLMLRELATGQHAGQRVAISYAA